MDHDERLLASALNRLSPSEEAQLQADLRADPALEREWQALRDALTSLVDGLELEHVVVPMGAEDRLLARLHAENPESGGAGGASPPAGPGLASSGSDAPAEATSRRPAWWLALPLGLAAAVALLFALRPPGDPVRQYASAPGAVSTPVVAGTQTLGTLVRLVDGRVYVHLNRPADTGRTYQLWQIQAGKPVSLGVFDQDGLLTASLPAGATVAVSVEPAGGSPQPTTTPLFAQGI